MTDRNNLITDFLATTDWAHAARGPLAGDASNRRYERLVQHDGSTAVLMDAPPSKGEDVRPFVAIATHLAQLGLSAPHIIAQDARNGLLVIEDLGDALFARVVATDPTAEATLYAAAVDVLHTLHQSPPPADLAPYSPKLMAEMAAHAYRWYLRGSGAQFEDLAQEFEAKFEPILAQHAPHADVLIQRDYHAENLLWLPDRIGDARVGLLDFQDALAGHRAYDLVSLLQDARRDVPIATERAMIDRYVALSGADRATFDAAYRVLGAQRNLRIIGVFARLSLHFGKAHYVDFIPRVWAYLQRDLDHPALEGIAPFLRATLPEPDNVLLQRLKDQCATIPTL